MRKRVAIVFAVFFFFVCAATANATTAKETIRAGKTAKTEGEQTSLGKKAPEKTEQKLEESEDVFEETLSLVEEANELIKEGKTAKAIKILDEAYRLMLKGEENNRQQDDLRLAISKAVTAAYGANLFKTAGLKSEIPLISNKDVDAEIRSFQTREREAFVAAYQRSFLYRPMIVTELKKAGMPEELSWLPLVESSFKTSAYSSARALGLWQFIPSTGYRYGLERDIWIDERMDPIKSTVAAIAYLRDLHGLFGDWLTVLAAYNCGEGKVMRHITRQEEAHADYFWDLYQGLPRETARYVPRFLATLHIVKDPEKYGFSLPRAEGTMGKYRLLTTNRAMRLGDIAKQAGVEEDDLVAMNAELRFKATPDREYSLRVPNDYFSKVEAAIEQVPVWKKVEKTREGISFVRHRVSKGETLTAIANRYGTTSKQIRRYNQATLRKGLVPGTTLKIPSRKVTDGKQPRGAIKVRSYRVLKGDTVASISQRSGVSVEAIKRQNRINGNALTPGQVLRIR